MNKFTRHSYEDGEESPIDFAAAFKTLNDLLGRHHLSLRMIVCGGYLIQQMGLRGTLDVDAFYNSTEEIDLLIQRVGALLGINSGKTVWLNNAVSTMSDWPDSQYCETLHEFSSLTVDQVTVEYMMGMKLSSTRPIDTEDVGRIIKRREIKDPIGLYNLLAGMSFRLSMVSVLDAFAFAYGDAWRAAYWKEHSKEILGMINSDW